MELTKLELKVLLMLIEREELANGLFPTEEKIYKKLQAKYNEGGGCVREV